MGFRPLNRKNTKYRPALRVYVPVFFCVISRGVPRHRTDRIVRPFLCNMDFVQIAIATPSFLDFRVFRTFLIHEQNRLDCDIILLILVYILRTNTRIAFIHLT
jgi:hypothetical protein